MGLKSGPGGVKATLTAAVPAAFRRFDSLLAARNEVFDGRPQEPDHDARRRETAIVLDGNVLMMNVPESLATFSAFADQFYRFVRAAQLASELVVVVFDEPEHLTRAKRAEQLRRDAARTQRRVLHDAEAARGTDAELLAQLSRPDASPSEFTAENLSRLSSVHALKNGTSRSAKAKLFDSVVRHVYERLMNMRMASEARGETNHGTVVFDGIDMRAWERSDGERRHAFVAGTSELADRCFERDVPVGEGDMKLVHVEQRLRTLKDTDDRVSDLTLVLVSTIDTDSFLTMFSTAPRSAAPSAAQRTCSPCCACASARRQTTNKGLVPVLRREHARSGIQRHLWRLAARAASGPTSAAPSP